MRPTDLTDVLEARQTADEGLDNLKAVSLRAITDGVPLSQVATAADVSRQTLYNWQAEAKE
jgi:DNA invertase Pin-like site-specific DNA recombinase